MAGARRPPRNPSRTEPGFREAAAGYVAARIDLIGAEARQAARHAMRRGMLAGLFAGLLLMTWSLLLAGLVGLLTEVLTEAGHVITWYWVAVALGLFHLLVAALVGAAASRPSPPPFEITRSELEKDRKWLEELRSTLRSKR